jgi:hypothetical protein
MLRGGEVVAKKGTKRAPPIQVLKGAGKPMCETVNLSVPRT